VGSRRLGLHAGQELGSRTTIPWRERRMTAAAIEFSKRDQGVPPRVPGGAGHGTFLRVVRGWRRRSLRLPGARTGPARPPPSTCDGFSFRGLGEIRVLGCAPGDCAPRRKSASAGELAFYNVLTGRPNCSSFTEPLPGPVREAAAQDSGVARQVRLASTRTQDREVLARDGAAPGAGAGASGRPQLLILDEPTSGLDCRPAGGNPDC